MRKSRLDSFNNFRKKTYDVAARALNHLIEEGGKAELTIEEAQPLITNAFMGAAMSSFLGSYCEIDHVGEHEVKLLKTYVKDHVDDFCEHLLSDKPS